jgi:uncharacterized membrane protein HdeD (DUF308 family)
MDLTSIRRTKAPEVDVSERWKRNLTKINRIIAAFTNRTGHDRWWVLLLEGLVGIAAGIITFFRPGLTIFVLLYVIAFWATVTGFLEIVAAIRISKEIQGKWMLALSGILSLVFGVLYPSFP